MDGLRSLAANPYPDPNHPLPKPIIVGGGLLMVTAVVLCAAAHATGVGVTRVEAPVPVESRDLVFAEGAGGVLRVTEADGGRAVATYPDGEGGFIRATVKALTRNRTLYGAPAVGAFRVSATGDGGVWLQDVATHQSIDLRAFGPNQVQAFGQFLRPEEPAR